MNEELFSKMLKEAGMSKEQFVGELGYAVSSLQNWSRTKYPSYVKPILEWAIKAKKYKEIKQDSAVLENDNKNLLETDRIKKNIAMREQFIKLSNLEKENKRLKNEIENIKQTILEWAIKAKKYNEITGL